MEIDHDLSEMEFAYVSSLVGDQNIYELDTFAQ